MKYLGATATAFLAIAVASFVGGCGGGDTASVFGPGEATGGTQTGAGGGTGASSSTGTGTTSTTTGIIGTGTPPPDAGGAGGGGALGDAACVNTAIRGDQRPVTLYFMVDNSGSMDTVDPGQTLSRWEIVQAAVPAFASDPANAGIFAGLDFFPENGGSCNLADYEMPNVPIDVLPGVGNVQANAFATAINTRARGGGGTPTTPALTGALAFSAMWQTAHPERTVYVVFVTDGLPNGCNSSVANATTAAAAGLAGTPSIQTYVLGLGTEITNNLDPVAMAGGTGTAYVVTMGGAGALSAALAAIKGTTITCDYNIPALDGGTIDFASVNVRTTIGSTGTPTLIGQVTNAAACGTAAGWFFDNPVPPGTPPPTKITLCPGSCDALQTMPGSQLDVLLGCKTTPRPPQ